jgi:dienelactone hydrolase
MVMYGKGLEDVSEGKFDFSPSVFHQTLAARTEQALRYPGGDVMTWQKTLRGRIRELIGYRGEATPRVPLEPRLLWRRWHPLGTIEKMVFRSEPGVDTPIYLCLPKNAKPPYTYFICLQGHTTGMHNSISLDYDEVNPIEPEGDRDFALGCMARGVAALCIEQRSFGQRREFIQPQSLDYLCHQAAMNALMLGTSLLAERVFDVDRAIDYLAERGDADMDRIGVMGNSGGGTTTLFAAALLPRVRAAMPACCFSTFQASIQSMFHCVCNYVPGILKVAEMGDIAGLMAPRPLVIVSGEQDGIFPLGPARCEFARVQAIYSALDAPDRCRHVVGKGGHQFYADDAWPVMLEMMNRASKRIP